MMPKPHAKQKPNQYILDFWSVSPENIQRAPFTAWNQVLYCVTVLFWMQDDARWCNTRWCKFTTFHNQKKASAACWALCGSRKVPGGQMNLAGDHLLAAPEVPTITIVEYMLNTCWIHVEYLIAHEAARDPKNLSKRALTALMLARQTE